jgi:hypothetical protein
MTGGVAPFMNGTIALHSALHSVRTSFLKSRRPS